MFYTIFLQKSILYISYILVLLPLLNPFIFFNTFWDAWVRGPFFRDYVNTFQDLLLFVTFQDLLLFVNINLIIIFIKPIKNVSVRKDHIGRY